MTAVVDRIVPGTWSDFRCEVNAIPPAELFARYERSRFLYPGKRARLAPYWPLILENWERARRAGELLHWVTSYDEPDGGWASLTSWRSTHAGWHIQHLVSSGTLAGGRAIMLAAQAAGMRERQVGGAAQNWFTPSNRFAALAFGTIARSLSPEHCLVAPGNYVMVPLALAHTLGTDGGAGTVVELDGGACPELTELARRCRGEVYVRAEGLDRDDLRLTDVDRLYRLVGLRRYRRLWILYDASGTVRAAALAYRGPLGFNFSFLENRCDLLTAPGLDAADTRRATDVLLVAAGRAYADFEPAAVPLATTTPVDHLVLAGAQSVRPYTRALWLAQAYPDFYRHIDELYAHRLHGRGTHPRSSA